MAPKRKKKTEQVRVSSKGSNESQLEGSSTRQSLLERLHPEIITLIVETLAASYDDRDEYSRNKDLCSLACCRLLSVDAERVLYRSLTFWSGGWKAGAIIDKMKSGAAKYVQELAITGYGEQAVRRGRSSRNTYSDVPFAQMTSLRVLCIYRNGENDMYNHVRNPEIFQLLRESLPKNILHTFVYLLPYEAEDLEFLKDQNGLRRLTLHTLPVETRSCELLKNPSFLPKLEHLGLARLEASSSIMMQGLPGRSIHSLEIRTAECIPETWGIFAEQLTILDLSQTAPYKGGSAAFIECVTKNLPNLRLFRISWLLLKYSMSLDLALMLCGELERLQHLEASEIRVYYPGSSQDDLTSCVKVIDEVVAKYSGASLQSILIRSDFSVSNNRTVSRVGDQVWRHVFPSNSRDWLDLYAQKASSTK
ncbi:hypothetical protein SISSUDRAFT_1053168 [Sistotremastrum suecicum HHB10207 ss-3]|uniref:F-box domain-containing protein n=1 Tax=Sistotremastrum suecicum HHB10207 ss-3 TaxID=1314776 RepID=A0A165ZDN0_9AGAM|nr:hypothetical protein SISSUDRAFT_1053168 [Sistotremastrum suecicum HHB10207 ss-3]